MGKVLGGSMPGMLPLNVIHFFISVPTMLRLHTPTTFHPSTHPSLIGQNVTSAWKKATYLTPTETFKGPHPRTAPCLSLVIQRTALFAIWGDKAFLPQSVKVGPDGSFYIVSKTLGTLPPPEHTVEKAFHPSDKTLSGKVVRRETEMGLQAPRSESGGSSRLIDVLRINGSVSPEVWDAVLYHFLCRFISRSADTGLWNVLIGPDGRPHGIDFEEMRGKENEMPLTTWNLLFVRKPAKAFHSQILEAIEKGKAGWVDKLKHLVLPHLCPLAEKDAFYKEMFERALWACAVLSS